MRLRIKKETGAEGLPLPKYHSADAAGIDLHAAENAVLDPGQHKLISAGIHVEIPRQHFGLVTPRSGLGKYGISIVNSPGIIDADYRGVIYCNLINHGKETFIVKKGERIAQMVILPFMQVYVEEASDLSDTDRGHGGFGSTGR